MDLRVELQQPFGTAFGAGQAYAALVKEKIDAQVYLANCGIVDDGKAANA